MRTEFYIVETRDGSMGESSYNRIVSLAEAIEGFRSGKNVWQVKYRRGNEDSQGGYPWHKVDERPFVPQGL